MKQLTLGLLLFIVGCAPRINTLLIGKWYVQEAIFNNNTIADVQGGVIEFKDGKTLIFNKGNQVLAGSWKSFYQSQPMTYNDQFFDMGQSIFEISMPDSTKWVVGTGAIGRKTMKLKSQKGRERTRLILSKM